MHQQSAAPHLTAVSLLASAAVDSAKFRPVSEFRSNSV